MVVEAIGAMAHIGRDDSELTNFEVIKAELGSDTDAPCHGLEGSVAMEQVKAEAECLVEEDLFALAKEFGAAGSRGAHSAGGGNPATIDQRFGRGCKIEESLLAKNLGPDRLVSFPAIAIKRVVPAGAGINVFAILRIAAITRLVKSPTIRDSVVHVGDGMQHFPGNVFDIRGVGVEPAAKFTVGARGGLCSGGIQGAEFRQTRKAWA